MANTKGRGPDFQLPHTWASILGDDAKKIFGENADKIMALLDDNQRALENNIIRPEITGSLHGAVATSTSTPWWPKKGQWLTEFHVLLGTAGSSNTVVIININGSPVTGASVTLASSATSGIAYVNQLWKNDTDVLTFQITTAGTGAKDLTAIARFI